MIDEELIKETEPTNENQEEQVVETEVINPEEPDKKHKKKKSKARVITEWVLTGIFGVIFVFVLIGQVDGMVNAKKHYNQQIRLGTGSFIVTTSSMEPEYPIGTAIVTYRDKEEEIIERFNKGETVDLTFMNSSKFSDYCPRDNEKWQNPIYEVTTGKVMTHRLMEVHFNAEQNKYYFVTAGINVIHEGDEGYDSDLDYRKEVQYQITDYDHILGVVKVNSPFLGQAFKIISSPIGLLVLLLIPALYLIVTSSIDIIKTLKASEETNETEKKEPSSLDTLSDKDIARLKEEMLNDMIAKSKQKQQMQSEISEEVEKGKEDNEE